MESAFLGMKTPYMSRAPAKDADNADDADDADGVATLRGARAWLYGACGVRYINDYRRVALHV